MNIYNNNALYFKYLMSMVDYLIFYSRHHVLDLFSTNLLIVHKYTHCKY